MMEKELILEMMLLLLVNQLFNSSLLVRLNEQVNEQHSPLSLSLSLPLPQAFRASVSPTHNPTSDPMNLRLRWGWISTPTVDHDFLKTLAKGKREESTNPLCSFSSSSCSDLFFNRSSLQPLLSLFFFFLPYFAIIFMDTISTFNHFFTQDCSLSSFSFIGVGTFSFLKIIHQCFP